MSIEVSMLQAPKVDDGNWSMFGSEEEIQAAIDNGVISLPSWHNDSGEENLYESHEDYVDFILGRGDYEDTNSFDRSSLDKDRQMEILRAMGWRCPACEEDIQDMLEQGAMRGEINRDTLAEVFDGTSERETYKHGEDTREEYFLAAYCKRHDEAAFFSYDIATDSLEKYWQGEV